MEAVRRVHTYLRYQLVDQIHVLQRGYAVVYAIRLSVLYWDVTKE